MAKIQPPAAIYSKSQPASPLPVTLREVDRTHLRLHTAHWDEASHEAFDGAAVTFVGLQGRYKIQFQIPRLNRVLIPPARNGAALEGNFFECRYPEQIWRINRRAAFRALPGMRTPVWCHLNLPNQKPLIAKVVDISFGGVGLEVPNGELDYAVGTIWPACTLRFGEHRHILHCTLKVTSIANKSSRVTHKRLGCILTLDDPLLAATFQMLLYDIEVGTRHS